MGHGDNDTCKSGEVILQDGEGGDVQVIGGLVQKQYIAACRQHRQQVEPALFPAGELSDGGVLHGGVKKEVLQQGAGTDGALTGGDVLRNVLDIVDDPLGGVHVLRGLGKIADLYGLAPFNGAGVRLDLPCDELHEGGLAAAVFPDDADALVPEHRIA